MTHIKKRSGFAAIEYLLVFGVVVFLLAVSMGIVINLNRALSNAEFVHNAKMVQKNIILVRESAHAAPISDNFTRLSLIDEFTNLSNIPTSVASQWEYKTTLFSSHTLFGMDKNLGYGRVSVRIPPDSYTSADNANIIQTMRIICLNGSSAIMSKIGTQNSSVPRYTNIGDECVILEGTPLR